MKKNYIKLMTLKTFLELVEIPSPSGGEALVAEYIKEKMTKLGLSVWCDNAGEMNNSNTGNVYAYLEIDNKKPTLVFSAHMDTVQGTNDKVKPIISNGFVKSNGKTILGADNKAGVATLLTVAKLINKQSLKNNLLFFFPTREEAGIMGSSQFVFDKSNIRYIFNLDSSDKPGMFINKSLGYENFEIVVKGLSVHAAKSYDRGVDAIKAAGILISRLPIGKNMEEGWTLNVGIINGGSGTNIVCDEVVLKGEMRTFDEKTACNLRQQIVRICNEISVLTGAKISFVLDKHSAIPPFVRHVDSNIIGLCDKACKKQNLEFILKESYSTSDSNFFSAKGYDVISVSRGGENAHSKNEVIRISDLKKTLELVVEMVEGDICEDEIG